jgi:hypothetical protein
MSYLSLRQCLLRTIVVLLFLLLSAAFTYPVHAQVYRSDDPGWNYYYNDNMKVYLEFPSSWTLKETDHSILVTADGAKLEITQNLPGPGTAFPSSDTRVDQVANNLIRDSTIDMELVKHGPTTSYGGPGYFLSYFDNSEVEPKRVDDLLLSTNGYLYLIEYTVDDSLYKQLRDSILPLPILVGDSYDKHMIKINDLKTRIQNLQGQSEKLLTDVERFGAKAQQGAMDNWLGIMQDSVEFDRQLNEAAEKRTSDCYNGINTVANC